MAPLASIFPPDSIPAWTTIFTGRGPGDHGYLDSIDYLDDDAPDQRSDDRRKRAAPPHVLGRRVARGLKVCVVNPVPRLPGLGRQRRDDRRAGVRRRHRVDHRDRPRSAAAACRSSAGSSTFPTRKTVGPFVEQTLADTRAQADFGRRCSSRSAPDLFFMNLLTVDRIKHFLWRFVDPDDPTYPGPNPHAEAIDRMYDAHRRDRSASSRRVGDVIVLSDHGHGRRCTRMVYVDEALRRAGLVARAGGTVPRLSKPLPARAGEAARAAHVLRARARGRDVPPGAQAAEPQVAQVLVLLERRRTSRSRGCRGRSAATRTAASRWASTRPRTGAAVKDVLRGSAIRRPVSRSSSGSATARTSWRARASTSTPRCCSSCTAATASTSGSTAGCSRPDVNHRRISGGHRPIGVFGSSVPVDPPASIEEFHDFVVGRLDRYASPARQ